MFTPASQAKNVYEASCTSEFLAFTGLMRSLDKTGLKFEEIICGFEVWAAVGEIQMRII